MKALPTWRVGQWGDGSSPPHLTNIFCDAHEATIVAGIDWVTADDIATAHNEALSEVAALSSLDRTTLPKAEGWQTMTSAPKDGTRVDLWVRPWDAFANGNPARITDAWFDDGEWKRHLAGWPHNVSSCGEPTHWMPISTAPSDGAR